MADEKNLKTLIDGDLKDRLDAVLERKGASLTGFVGRMVGLFLEQDDLVQSMLLGQLDASDDLMEIVLKRLKVRRGVRSDVVDTSAKGKRAIDLSRDQEAGTRHKAGGGK